MIFLSLCGNAGIVPWNRLWSSHLKSLPTHHSWASSHLINNICCFNTEVLDHITGFTWLGNPVLQAPSWAAAAQSYPGNCIAWPTYTESWKVPLWGAANCPKQQFGSGLCWQHGWAVPQLLSPSVRYHDHPPYEVCSSLSL